MSGKDAWIRLVATGDRWAGQCDWWSSMRAKRIVTSVRAQRINSVGVVGKETGNEVGGSEKQQGLAPLPLCISPTPAQRSAGRIECAGALVCSCGIGPQRLRRTRVSPAEGSGSLGCPRWAGSTGDAGWISRPCSHTKPNVESTQNSLVPRHSRQVSIDCVCSEKTLALTSALCCSSPLNIKCRRSESLDFRLQPWHTLLSLCSWLRAAVWMAEIPTLTSTFNNEESGLCNCPVYLFFYLFYTLELHSVISVEFPPWPVDNEAETWEVTANLAICFCCSSSVMVFSY